MTPLKTIVKSLILFLTVGSGLPLPAADEGLALKVITSNESSLHANY